MISGVSNVCRLLLNVSGVRNSLDYGTLVPKSLLTHTVLKQVVVVDSLGLLPRGQG